jgi:tetratricopeptide (TPR) repeat protein
MSDTAQAEKRRSSDEHRVPAWLALLVAVLTVAVIGVGAYAVRVARPSAASGEQMRAQLRVDAAKAQFKSSKGSTEARLQLAYAYQRAGNYSAARKQYAAVLKVDRRNVAAEFNLGVIDELNKNPEGASAHYKNVLLTDPGHELAAKQLSLIQYANEDWKGMLATIEPAIASNPDLSDLRYLLGVAYEKTGQREKAIEQYRTALKFYPNLREAKEALARLQ